mgnify:CR=1 FL=1
MSRLGDPFNRRRFLARNAMGIGGLALAWLLKRDRLLATPKAVPRGRRSFDLAPKTTQSAGPSDRNRRRSGPVRPVE